jgi:hypothetical protein
MYIDPNTGGMLFQVLAVLFGVISTALLLFSGRIRLAIAKIRRRVRENAASKPESTYSDQSAPPPSA